MENGQERKHLREYRETFEKLKKAEQKRDAIAVALETVEPDSAGAASQRKNLRQLEETIARYETRLAKLENAKPLQALLKRLRSEGTVANAEQDGIINTNGGNKTGNSIVNGSVVISEKQFGKKFGKHASDFGLDPTSPEDRATFLSIINDIVDHPTELRIGEWRGQPMKCCSILRFAML